MNRLSKVALLLLLSSQLTGCLTAVVGGAAVGGSMATDRRTSGIYVEDENIEVKAERKLAAYLGDDAHTNVVSFNLNVLITGEVPNEEKRRLAETLVKEIPNVHNIQNSIKVGMVSSLSSRSNDAYITTKVKSRLLTNNSKITNYIKVFTEAGVVYLMGIVTQEEANAAVDIAKTTSGVTQVVKVFEYTK